MQLNRKTSAKMYKTKIQCWKVNFEWNALLNFKDFIKWVDLLMSVALQVWNSEWLQESKSKWNYLIVGLLREISPWIVLLRMPGVPTFGEG